MKKIYAALMAASFCASASAASAATDAPAAAAPGASRTPQQSRMAICNKEAAAQGKKRAERRAFMKTCLKGVTNATIAPESSREKTGPALESPKP